MNNIGGCLKTLKDFNNSSVHVTPQAKVNLGATLGVHATTTTALISHS